MADVVGRPRGRRSLSVTGIDAMSQGEMDFAPLNVAATFIGKVIEIGCVS